MPGRVLDCNVLAAANGNATHQTPECEEASVRALKTASKGLIVLDDDDLILDSYRAMTNPRAQPGPAELFVRWLYQVRYTKNRCRLVHLDRDASGEFSSYPLDPEFHAFDPDDRVFVAVAVGSNLRPEVVNATDTDWLVITHALERYGVRVRNLCV